MFAFSQLFVIQTRMFVLLTVPDTHFSPGVQLQCPSQPVSVPPVRPLTRWDSVFEIGDRAIWSISEMYPAALPCDMEGQSGYDLCVYPDLLLATGHTPLTTGTSKACLERTHCPLEPSVAEQSLAPCLAAGSVLPSI